MAARRWYLRLVNCVLMASLNVVALPSPARANACSGSHGVYTDVLCIGDNIVGSGAYIASGNGSYRMYLGGSLVVYHWNGSGWDPIYTVYDSGDAGEAYEAAITAGCGGQCTQLGFYDNYSSLLEYDENESWDEYASDYLQLENNGCLWFHHTYNDARSLPQYDAYWAGCDWNN